MESLGGLVMQVPENQEVVMPQTNPYSPRNSHYYLSEVVKNYKINKSLAR
jgi:hypothetical protein